MRAIAVITVDSVRDCDLFRTYSFVSLVVIAFYFFFILLNVNICKII